jgi:mono/diheme cytochrome c family protein
MPVSVNASLLRGVFIAAMMLIAAAAGQSQPAADHPGRTAHLANCAGCHGEKLVGQFGKPLTGDAFRASDSATSTVLWETRLSGSPSAAPISFPADGVQYVATTTGGGDSPHDATVSALTPEIEPGKSGTMLWVFKLGVK